MSVKIVRPKGKGGVVADEAIKIYTPSDLYNVRNDVTGNYKLMNDIDLIGYTNWLPIAGSLGELFSGTFDGQNFDINNLTINSPTDTNSALFLETDKATFKNIRLTNIDVIGGDYTSGLVGTATDTHFEKCYVQGKVYNEGGTISALVSEMYTSKILDSVVDCEVISLDAYVGGFVSYMTDSIIENCHSRGHIKGQAYVGGICGNPSQNDILNEINFCSSSALVVGDNYVGGIGGLIEVADIYKCWSTGKIEGSIYVGGIAGQAYNDGNILECFSKGNIKGSEYVGGIIGIGGSVYNSYSTGKVSGENYLGGITGMHTCIIKNCFSTSDVIGTDSFIGGLIGVSQSGNLDVECYAENCFSTGLVVGVVEYFGGFVGFNEDELVTPDFRNCYFDSETSLQTNIYTGIVAKTTAEMKDIITFPTFDFSSLWRMRTTEYPELR